MKSLKLNQPEAQFDADQYLAQAKENGFFILKNFLSEQELSQIRAEMDWFLENSRPWYKKKDGDRSQYAIVCPQGMPKFEKDRIKKTCSIMSQPFFERIARGYLNDTVILNTFIVNREKAHKRPITEWHADQQKVGLFVFKYMIYLNDVSAKNGAFCYVPKSHSIVRKIIERGRLKGIPNTDIHNFEEIKKWAYELKLDDCIEFIDSLEGNIKGDFESNDQYALSAPAGSIIAFDPSAIHRGGVVSEGERYIVRLHCFERSHIPWQSRLKNLLVGSGQTGPFFPVGSSRNVPVITEESYN